MIMSVLQCRHVNAKIFEQEENLFQSSRVFTILPCIENIPTDDVNRSAVQPSGSNRSGLVNTCTIGSKKKRNEKQNVRL